MGLNSACSHFLSKLSPFVDGELSVKERTTVETHLSACEACKGRVTDFRAESGLIRVGLELMGDEVDFQAFTQVVMSRVTPERAPLWERFKLSLSETFTYQRGPLVAGAVAVMAMVAVAVPLATRTKNATGYGTQTVALESVSTDEQAHVAPVVLKSGSDQIIWLVDHADHAATLGVSGGPDSDSPKLDGEGRPLPGAPEQRPQGGDL